MGFMPAGLSKGGDDSTDDTDEVVPGPELLEDPLGETTASLHVASGRERTEPEPAAGTVKKVAGRIGDDGLTMELTGEADAPPGLTFHVLGGDSLEWNFRNVPPGARVQVHFDGFQAHPDQAHGAGFVTLFERQPPVSAPAGGDRATAVSSEPVRSRSFPGTYWYTVALLRPDAPPVVLQCVWNGRPVAAGGGEKSGRPTS
ncbi:MAG: hypothetical protein ABW221_03415 [Vicinamibacteria bacterium]